MKNPKTNAPIEHLATLASLSIPAGRLPTLAKEFESILAYVSQIESLSLPREATPPIPALRNVLREDADPAPARAHTKDITYAFPEKKGDALMVKKIISND